MFSYVATVDAGIDYSEILVEGNNETGYKVTIPKAKILGDVTIENDSYQEYVDSDNIFNKNDAKLVNTMQKKLKKDAIEQAEKNGIIELAQKNAEEVIKGKIPDNVLVDFITPTE